VFVSKATHNMEVKDVISMFSVLQGDAEILIRCGGKIYHFSIACLL